MIIIKQEGWTQALEEHGVETGDHGWNSDPRKHANDPVTQTGTQARVGSGNQRDALTSEVDQTRKEESVWILLILFQKIEAATLLSSFYEITII